jgi:hypothetical protein
MRIGPLRPALGYQYQFAANSEARSTKGLMWVTEHRHIDER